MLTRGKKGWRKTAGWLGLVALLLQTLIPLGQAVAAPAAGSLAADLLVICSQYGKTLIDQQQDGSDGTPAGHPECPVCLSYALGGGLAPADGVVLPVPHASQSQALAPAILLARDGRALSTGPARAPPAQA